MASAPRGAAKGGALPWSVREALTTAFRARVVKAERDRALVDALVGVIAELGKRQPALRLLGSDAAAKRALARRIRGWVDTMPATRRAEWLVEALSEAYGLSWQREDGPDEGPIPLPASWQARLLRKLDRLFDATVSRHDDEPQPEEVSDLVLEELDRLASTNERLARRLQVRRFDSGDPRLPLTFAQVLEKEQPTRAEDVLRILEARLEVEWVG